MGCAPAPRPCSALSSSSYLHCKDFSAKSAAYAVRCQDARVPSVSGSGTERRAPLSRARVIDAAIELADREGIDAVSMRRLGQELGIEAMSLYTHVRSKDDLLDGMADGVVALIPVMQRGEGWAERLRGMILGAREVMLGHRWAARVIETRGSAG